MWVHCKSKFLLKLAENPVLISVQREKTLIPKQTGQNNNKTTPEYPEFSSLNYYSHCQVLTTVTEATSSTKADSSHSLHVLLG